MSLPHTHAAAHAQPIPKAILIGAGLLVGFSLSIATAARLLHWQATPLPVARAVTVLHLNFRDRSDGAVEVLDADLGDALVQVLAPGTNGFARGVLRGLARQRYREGAGALSPFTLTRWSDGRLTLVDPQTDRRVSLEVFGPTNAEPFVAMFAADSALTRAAADASASVNQPVRTLLP
jgi:putative photosynthetic complex assembly protein